MIVEQNTHAEAPLEIHLEQLGRSDLLPASHIRQLDILLFLARGYEMVCRENGTNAKGALNELGTLIVERITSSPERLDFFARAIAQSAYRAGRANRADLMGFGPGDGSLVQDVMMGWPIFELPSFVVPEEENEKVYQWLIKAVEPEIIDGQAVVIDSQTKGNF